MTPVPAPAAVAFMDRVKAVEKRVAQTQGVINAAYGEMVDALAGAHEHHVMEGWGIHSPGHWVAWQTGCSLPRGHGLAKLAKRASELPSVVAALRAGELSVDHAVAIAKKGPAQYERSITEFAKMATLGQLQSSLGRYNYEDPDVDQSNKRHDRRSVSQSHGDDGLSRFNAKLELDEGAVLSQALEAAFDDLRRQARADAPEGTEPRRVTMADALVAVAETFLRTGEAMFPGSDRYLVHLHLEGNPVDGDMAKLSFHLGGRVPEALRSLLLCGQVAFQPTYWAGTTPLSVGRKTRNIDRKLHRVIEHRDGGCRVPGCERTHGLEIHHIAHWEHGGPTDTANLVTLCHFHHRTHHQGLLAITGNPEHPEQMQGTLESAVGPADQASTVQDLLGSEGNGPLRFTDQWGRTLASSGTPIRPNPGHSPEQGAEAIDAAPTATFAHPLGERMQPGGLFFSRNDGRFPTRSKPIPEPPADEDPADTSTDPPIAVPHKSRLATNETWTGPGDPRHGGPPTSTSPPAA